MNMNKIKLNDKKQPIEVQASYRIDFLKCRQHLGSRAGPAELQAEPSAGFRAADDKERKQTVGTFPLMLIELGAIYRLSEIYSPTHQCYSIQSAFH